MKASAIAKLQNIIHKQNLYKLKQYMQKWKHQIFLLNKQQIQIQKEQKKSQSQNDKILIKKLINHVIKFKHNHQAVLFQLWKHQVQNITCYKKNSYTYQLDQSSEVGSENIDDDEGVLSKEKKLVFDQNKILNRTKNSEQYNFSYPTARLEELPTQHQLFQQILDSPNKDFGKLMNNDSEICIQQQQYYEEQNYFDTRKMNAIFLIRCKLQSYLRQYLQYWKRETDQYLLIIHYKIQHQEQNLKKQILRSLIKVKSINDKVLMRNLQYSFNCWKLKTIVDEKAKNKKLEQYFMTNAKQDVQQSKYILHKLYQQQQRDNNEDSEEEKDIYDERIQMIQMQNQSKQEIIKQVKGLCYDMLLDILEEAENNQSGRQGINDQS